MLIEPDNITIVFVPRVTNLNNIIVSIEFCIHLNFSAHTIKQNSRTFFPRSYTTYTRILWIHPQGRLLQSIFFKELFFAQIIECSISTLTLIFIIGKRKYLFLS